MRFKKKIICLLMCLMLVVAPLLFTGCNKQVFDFKLTFNRAYCKIGETWVDLEISKWKDYAGEQIQLILNDGTILLVSSNYCILYNGTLPKVAEDE